jgi:hypothetical protein
MCGGKGYTRSSTSYLRVYRVGQGDRYSIDQRLPSHELTKLILHSLSRVTGFRTVDDSHR